MPITKERLLKVCEQAEACAAILKNISIVCSGLLDAPEEINKGSIDTIWRMCLSKPDGPAETELAVLRKTWALKEQDKVKKEARRKARRPHVEW